MSKSKKKAGFTTLITKFPKAKLPLVLSPDSYRNFEKKNKPLSLDSIQNFLLDEQEEVDEFTEFIPCFRLPDTSNFHALVFWRAGLMEYHYVLITFDKKGYLIDKKSIAGTIPHENAFIISIADIKSSRKIEVKEGSADTNTKNLTPTSFSHNYHLDISDNGKITTQ